jgi:hypothetical protein
MAKKRRTPQKKRALLAKKKTKRASALKEKTKLTVKRKVVKKRKATVAKNKAVTDLARTIGQMLLDKPFRRANTALDADHDIDEITDPQEYASIPELNPELPLPSVVEGPDELMRGQPVKKMDEPKE